MRDLTIRNPLRHLVLLVLLVVVAAGAAAQKPTRGKVKKGVFHAPGELFTVPAPSGFSVSDIHWSDHGAVSFHNDFGKLMGIHYTVASGGDDPLSLSPWLHSIALPTWFVPASRDSRVLAESLGTFEDMPALFALIEAPGGNAVRMMTIVEGKIEAKLLDSRRVVVIFRKGRFVWMLTNETMPLGGTAPPSAAPADWASRADDLRPFYRSIVFAPQE